MVAARAPPRCEPVRHARDLGPDGVNLAWTTSVPGLAVLFAPVTLLAGPVAAYNVAAVLMPALAAWTCFLLCRHLTRSTWSSLIGGYLFGFSSYMLGQQEGHLHMTSVFLIPLIALVLVCFVQGTIDRRQLTVRLGLLLAAQLTFSTEIFFTVTIAIATATVLAYLVAPQSRYELRSAGCTSGRRISPRARHRGTSRLLRGLRLRRASHQLSAPVRR